MSDVHANDARDGGLVGCLLLVAFTAISTLSIQYGGIINSDVSFLAWTARQVMGPAVFGVDIYEVNPPLAFMIYTPAALIAPLTGFDLAIKLWVTALGCLSVAMFWQTCDTRLRLPLAVTLAIFIAFVLPGGFGQREQIAFMLTAPYVAGSSRHWAVGLLVGVMAGVGFAIKPYFLIPLALVFATRRKIGTAEWAIAATGMVYAATLLLFFRPYLFEFMPLARATYWAVHQDAGNTWYLTGFILLALVPFSLAGAPQPAARSFIAASLGFTIAAFIQFKGFSYHFEAALGFLLLFLMARVFNARRLIGVCAAITLVAYSYIFGGSTLEFSKLSEGNGPMVRLLPEIDRSPSFLSLALTAFPAFPTALYTKSDYKGKSIWPIFISAARYPDAGVQSQDRARELTIGQAVDELARKPELVIIEREDMADGWGRSKFDLLGFYETDARFRVLWADYSYDKTVAGYDLYRRR